MGNKSNDKAAKEAIDFLATAKNYLSIRRVRNSRWQTKLSTIVKGNMSPE